MTSGGNLRKIAPKIVPKDRGSLDVATKQEPLVPLEPDKDPPDLDAPKTSVKKSAPLFKPRVQVVIDPKPTTKARKPRTDTKIRNFENKYLRFRTIKMKLSTFCKDKDFLSIIHMNVTEMNHITFLVYHFLNFHFLRLLDQKLTIPKSITQDMLQNAYQDMGILLRTKSKKSARSPDWKASLELFRTALNESSDDQLYQFPSKDYRGTLSNNASKIMLIAINNHLNLNFSKRLASYLKVVHKEADGAKAHYWADRILNYRRLDLENPGKFGKDESSQELIEKYRKELSIDNDVVPEISDDLPKFLPYYHKMLKSCEEAETKRFSILPLKGEFGESYIKIDTSGLADIIISCGEETALRDKIKKDPKLKYKIWGERFNLNLVEMRKFRFGHELVTNGYDASITIKEQIKEFPPGYDNDLSPDEKYVFITAFYKAEQNRIKAEKEANKNKPKKKLPIKEENEFQAVEWTEYLRILGLDPGRRSLYSVYDPVTGKAIQCSAKEWKHLTGQTKNLYWRNNRKATFETIQELNEISFKRSDSTVYLENLKKLVPKLKTVFAYYGKNCCKKRKFNQYIKTQKAYNTIITRLVSKKKIKGKTEMTYIGFGNGAVNTNGCCKGAKVPCKALFNRMKSENRLYVRYVNEHYTTKRCSQCKHDTIPVYMEKEKEQDGEKIKFSCLIHGLRRCGNNECCILWDRDQNASINTRIITVSLVKKEERPTYLTKEWIHPDGIKLPTKKKTTKKQKTNEAGTEMMLPHTE